MPYRVLSRVYAHDIEAAITILPFSNRCQKGVESWLGTRDLRDDDSLPGATLAGPPGLVWVGGDDDLRTRGLRFRAPGKRPGPGLCKLASVVSPICLRP